MSQDTSGYGSRTIPSWLCAPGESIRGAVYLMRYEAGRAPPAQYMPVQNGQLNTHAARK